MKLLLISLAAVNLCAAGLDLQNALRKVEERYNGTRSMQVDFEQTFSYSAQPSAKRRESGVLYLRKPGKMRWDYLQPQKKIFLSDGKDVYFYSATSNRAERSKVKETEDMRAPLAFLLGKLDFSRDFREYRTRPEGDGYWIEAKPKSDKAPYREVQFLLTPQHQITRLRVVGQDQSVMDFTFRNEKRNPDIADSLFKFELPPGAQLVDVQEQSN